MSDTNINSVFNLQPKSKNNLRILNVNCQKIQSKRAELQTAIQYIKPDVIFCTESWLTGTKPGKNPNPGGIASSEVFPPDYNVFRNDRNQFGGGVFILTHKSLTAEEQPDMVTNCEMNWVKIKMEKRKERIVERNEESGERIELREEKRENNNLNIPVVMSGYPNLKMINYLS